MSVKHTQRGVGMVEALVALVILAVGMLGIAALFVESMRSSRSAFSRTQAVNFANDLADRIRSNRFGQGAYVLAVGDLPDLLDCAGGPNNCDPADLAQDDLARWVRTVQAALPWDAAGNPPQTSVAFVQAAATTQPDQYTITVDWAEPDAQRYNYTINMQLIRGAAL
jgi:type IV pilus assembly protein PilV